MRSRSAVARTRFLIASHGYLAWCEVDDPAAASREVLLPYSTWQPLAFAGSWEIWRDVEEQCAGDGDRGLPIGSPGRLSLSTRWPRGLRAMARRR